MRRRVAAVLATALIATVLAGCGPEARKGSAGESEPGCGPPIAKADGTEWTCVLADGFDGDALDTSLWTVVSSAASGYRNGPECYLGEGSPLGADDVVVADGTLRLTARGLDHEITCPSLTGDFASRWTGAFVTTYGKFTTTYGRIEIRAAFPDATRIRPAVMFGPDDAFLTTILKLLRRLPIYPMFGRGLTRLQPAYVDDVAEAIATVLQGTEMHAMTYECGGPRVYSYKEFLRTVAHEAGLRPLLIPLPFGAWHALAWVSEMLPSPPVTRNQVELMQVDNVSSPEMPGFGDLGISPRSVEEIFQEMLRLRDH